MYFLDAQQTRDRITTLGFSWQTIEDAMGPFFNAENCETSRTRDEFFNSFSAAKEAVSFFGHFKEALLYIHSLGGRASIENRHLFETLRHSFGEHRPNHLAPGHVFQDHDLYTLITFCDVVINYGFRAVLIQHCSRNWLSFTDDDEMHRINVDKRAPH